jgi:hypothetical protein
MFSVLSSLGGTVGGWGVKDVLGGLGGLGLGVKVLVRDRLGVIAKVAATARPSLVTAAAPRELHIDPRKKKSKRAEFAR